MNKFIAIIKRGMTLGQNTLFSLQIFQFKKDTCQPHFILLNFCRKNLSLPVFGHLIHSFLFLHSASFSSFAPLQSSISRSAFIFLFQFLLSPQWCVYGQEVVHQYPRPRRAGQTRLLLPTTPRRGLFRFCLVENFKPPKNTHIAY